MKLFDLHCDTLYECCETGKHLRENDLHVNRAAAQRYEHYVQFFALFCGAYPPESQKKKRSCLLDTPKDERLARMLKTAQTDAVPQRRGADPRRRKRQSGGVPLHRGCGAAARAGGRAR